MVHKQPLCLPLAFPLLPPLRHPHPPPHTDIHIHWSFVPIHASNNHHILNDSSYSLDCLGPQTIFYVYLLGPVQPHTIYYVVYCLGKCQPQTICSLLFGPMSTTNHLQSTVWAKVNHKPSAVYCLGPGKPQTSVVYCLGQGQPQTICSLLFGPRSTRNHL